MMDLDITHNINTNLHVDPFLHNTDGLPDSTSTRIINLVTPFFALYKPARIAMTAGLGAVKCWTIIRGNATIPVKLLQLTVCVGSVALNIIIPIVGSFCSTVVQIGCDCRLMIIQLRNGEWKNAFLTLLSIVGNTLYLASIAVGSTELILLSLIAQAVKELYQAYRDFSAGGRTPEALAMLTMALIRLVQASGHARTVHRNYYGKQISEDSLKTILEDLRVEKEKTPEKQVNFEKILIDGYYSSKIKNVSFDNAVEDDILSSVNFQNLKLTECTLTGINFNRSTFSNTSAFYCDFSNSSFKDATFTNCNFLASDFTKCNFKWSNIDHSKWILSGLMNTSFYGSKITNSAFFGSDLESSNFAQSELKHVKFSMSDMSYAAFNKSTLDNVTISRNILKGTCFLEASVNNTTIRNSNLTDTLFIDTYDDFKIVGGTPNTFTGPVIGVLWNFEAPTAFTEGAYESVKECGGIPLRFDRLLPGVTEEAFDLEVEQALSDIAANGLPQGAISIPDAILKQAAPGSIIEQVHERTNKIMNYIDGLLMTGGADINSAFYGHEEHEEAWPDADHQRSMTEFSMVSHADSKELPILAICRGSQLVNVFRGGTLIQDVDDHWGEVHELTIDSNANPEASKVIYDIIGNGTRGYSSHHQSIDKVGQGLFVVMQHEGVPEATVSLDGRVVLLQFHPEMAYFMEQDAKKKNGGILPDDYPFADGMKFFENLVARSTRSAG